MPRILMACGLNSGRLLSRLYFAHLNLSLLLAATTSQPSSFLCFESGTNCKKCRNNCSCSPR